MKKCGEVFIFLVLILIFGGGLFRVLKALNETGTTIFIVEQNAHIALRYADRAYVMEAGRIVML